MNNTEMNSLFISMEYNDREFDGINEFKNELEAQCHYQIRPKWIPACSEGAELWMTIFVNSELAKFLASAVAGGLAWDLIKVGSKKYVFTPFFNALEKLNIKNEKSWGGINILRLKFQFDDCEIYVGGLNKSFTSVMSSVFREIAINKPKFENEVGQGVVKIELPIEVDEQPSKGNKYLLDIYNEDNSIEAYLKLWKITFTTEFPVMIYDFETDNLKEI